ncbi:MAG: hypothetical protein J6575_06835 [Bifidobacterium sp.]|nr:hypothetical protein [Bifidobacterium sp.]
MIRHGRTGAGAQRWRCPGCRVNGVFHDPKGRRALLRELDSFVARLLGGHTLAEEGRSFRRGTAMVLGGGAAHPHAQAEIPCAGDGRHLCQRPLPFGADGRDDGPGGPGPLVRPRVDRGIPGPVPRGARPRTCWPATGCAA